MQRFIETYTGQPFDVLVIGGGITGASIDYDAASRGLRVALVEKKDFSWATSAVTSKLIHGGLRYLANLEFGLVRESLRERTTLLNIAPNFVAPMPMLITHTRGPLKNNKWVVKCGLALYDLLAYDRNRVWDRKLESARQRILKGNTTQHLHHDKEIGNVLPKVIALDDIRVAQAG